MEQFLAQRNEMIEEVARLHSEQTPFDQLQAVDLDQTQASREWLSIQVQRLHQHLDEHIDESQRIIKMHFGEQGRLLDEKLEMLAQRLAGLEEELGKLKRKVPRKQT